MFDDVADLFEIITDSTTYTNPGVGVQRLEDFTRAHGRQKLLEGINEGAKRFALVPLGVKAIDAGVDRAGLDPDRALRNRIGLTEADVRSGGQNDLLEDEVTLHAQDEAPQPPRKDRTIGGWFDP